MKKTILIVVSMLLAGALFFGCGNGSKKSAEGNDTLKTVSAEKEKKILYYYDPMHPWFKFDHPGFAPDCGMELVPKYAGEGDDSNIITIDPAMVQNIGVVVAPVERRELTRTINTYGVVVPDEKKINDINTRVSGWIEKLYFDYTGMNVKKGEPMAVIYSPELIAAEQEFLQSVSFAQVSGKSVTQPDALIKSARDRLTFFGMSNKEIDELQTTGKIIDRVVIHSPADGVILEKNIFEGQRISAGQTLFRVANLSHVWILADVFKIDMPFLKIGSPATVSYSSAATYKGVVDFVYPEVDATARSVKARISLNNPGLVLKVGQFVNVAIHSSISYDAIAVPAQSVINTGLRQVVAVAIGGGKFEIRNVKLGAYADGYYEILEGLHEGENIVTSGQFLIDSDANLKSAGAAMAGMPGMSMPAQPTAPSSSGDQKDMENMKGIEINKGADSSTEKTKSMDKMDMQDMQMNHESHEGASQQDIKKTKPNEKTTPAKPKPGHKHDVNKMNMQNMKMDHNNHEH